MADLDPRITPARPDLAARWLEGTVTAERFVDGTPARVIEGLAPLRRQPRSDAGLDTEALYGEQLTVYDEDDEGWAWVRLARDGYVGWMPAHAFLKGEGARPTHKVAALRTFLYPRSVDQTAAARLGEPRRPRRRPPRDRGERPPLRRHLGRPGDRRQPPRAGRRAGE